MITERRRKKGGLIRCAQVHTTFPSAYVAQLVMGINFFLVKCIILNRMYIEKNKIKLVFCFGQKPLNRWLNGYITAIADRINFSHLYNITKLPCVQHESACSQLDEACQCF